MNITKRFLIVALYFWLHLDLVLGICLLGVQFGTSCIRNLVPSTGSVNAVVWLEWGVGICGVRLSSILALICSVVVICNHTSGLLITIGPKSILGLTHILLGVLR